MPVRLAAMDRVGQPPMRRALAAVVAIQLVVGVIAALLVSPTKASAVAPPPPPPSSPSLDTSEPGPGSPVAPGETDAADAVGPTVPLFESPAAAKPFKTLTNPTWEKVPLILHVIQDQGPWLQVRVNTRPNGSTAWIHRSDVTLRRVPNRIIIEIGARRLTVLHGNDVLAQHRVAVGSPRTPTPLGEFYVDATVRLNNHPTYGAGQLSVSGFSDVLHSFGGGIGQIAIHGWNSSGAMGQAVSNGCIRMVNDAFTQVANMSPNGTPVSIRP
jgi:lipoprotein-anchoring transpeptidase ErfK/SrfK